MGRGIFLQHSILALFCNQVLAEVIADILKASIPLSSPPE